VSDAGKRAIALGAWERALTDYQAAADQTFDRGALAGPPDDVELDLLEVLEWEQRQALERYIASCRE
jgi:hypothetical protein